jgi:hypothetical protein
MTKFLSEKELCVYLKEIGIDVSSHWCRKLRCRGGGITYQKFGGKVRYSLDDINAWVESSKKLKSTSDEAVQAA